MQCSPLLVLCAARTFLSHSLSIFSDGTCIQFTFVRLLVSYVTQCGVFYENEVTFYFLTRRSSCVVCSAALQVNLLSFVLFTSVSWAVGNDEKETLFIV